MWGCVDGLDKMATNLGSVPLTHPMASESSFDGQGHQMAKERAVPGVVNKGGRMTVAQT